MNPTILRMRDEIVEAGVSFDRNGMPQVPQSMLLGDAPYEILPFEHRKACKEKKKTLICFFSQDYLLERRLRRMYDDLPEYQKYMGVTGFDMSIRIGMSLDAQLRMAKINKIVDCWFAIHDVKVVPNFRTGDLASISHILNHGNGIQYSAGIIGCKRGSSALDDAILRAKIIYSRPSRILTYGNPSKNSARILKDFGVNYKSYVDFVERSRRGGFENGL